uniref:Uncharacterized protein n=1 Tax=Anopheles minimus TaxID=112268 RepID=A0A182WNX1_9DIPT
MYTCGRYMSEWFFVPACMCEPGCVRRKKFRA